MNVTLTEHSGRGDARTSTATGRGPDRLGPGLSIDGDIVTGDDMFLEGRLKGALHAAEHTVTIGAGGTVNGRVFGRVVIIEGAVQGEVTATGLIEIGQGARVEADLTAPSIAIAEGAFVVGKIDMRRADAAARVARYRLERASPSA
jgi:cytoskeletal protein CcmA (bactofilin family)